MARIDRHRRRLQHFRYRIAVSGVRGKSTVVKLLHDAVRRRELDPVSKITGTDPMLLDGERTHVIERTGPVLLDETIDHLRPYTHKDVAIIENNAIGPYTMRTFNHDLLDPHLLLIPTIRRDHLDRLPRRRRHIARIFGRTAVPGRDVLVAEPDDDVAEATMAAADAIGANAVRVAVPEGPPGMCNLALVDAALGHMGLPRLSDDEWDHMHARLERATTPSDLAGIQVLDASSANDVRTTTILADHGMPGRLDLVVSLRDDRPARSAEFHRLAEQWWKSGRVRQIFVAGVGADNFSDIAQIVPDGEEGVDAILARAGSHLLLAANHNTPIMRAFRVRLST